MIIFMLFLMVWVVLCVAAMRDMDKAVSSVVDKEVLKKRTKAARCLAWFDPEEFGKFSESLLDGFRWLLAPIYWALFKGNTGGAAERLQDEATEFHKAAQQLRSARWQTGKVWMHPREHGHWRLMYSRWFKDVIQPQLERGPKLARHGNSMQLVKLKKLANPCTCVEPLRGGVGPKYAWCSEGHVLPRNAPELLD